MNGGADAAMGVCSRQDQILPLAPGLLSFLASASDGIRTALHRPQVRRRRVNPRKYFQKQLHGCRMAAPLHRSLSRPPPPSPSEGLTRPPNAAQRVAHGRAVEQKSLDALFDPRTVAAELTRPAPLRRRRLPASFFTEPRSYCASPKNPVESPGSAASNDSNYADSQGSGSDPASHAASHLDLDALLASPFWTDDDDSTQAKPSPSNPAQPMGSLGEYTGLDVNIENSYRGTTYFHNNAQITKESNCALDVNLFGQQTDHFQNRYQQFYPSCQYDKRYDVSRYDTEGISGQEGAIMAPVLQTPNGNLRAFPLLDATGRYYISEIECDSVLTPPLQLDISSDAKQLQRTQNCDSDQRWLPVATAEVYSSIVLSPFSNCSPTQSLENDYQSPTPFAANQYSTVSSNIAPNDSQSRNSIYSSVCSTVDQVSDISWTSVRSQEATNTWQDYQHPTYESNTLFCSTSQCVTDNQMTMFYGAC